MENKSANNLKELITGNPGLAVILAGLVGVVIIAAVLLLLERGEDETLIYLDNTGQCPEVTLTLTNRADGEIITLKAKAGQRSSAKVEPNTIYDYILDTNSEPDESGMRCYNIDQGTIADIPKGRSVTVNVPSLAATPDPRTLTPESTEPAAEETPAS